jgi:hypothetical protein
MAVNDRRIRFFQTNVLLTIQHSYMGRRLALYFSLKHITGYFSAQASHALTKSVVSNTSGCPEIKRK